MSFDLPKAKLLIVDDFYEYRRSLKHMLEQIGYISIDLAANANEAIEKCEEKLYDIILCDYNLGHGMDGQDFHEEIRARSLCKPETIFIMITAEDSAAMVLASLEYEPDSYLTKPFGRSVLETRIQRVISRKKLLTNVYLLRNAGELDKAVKLCRALSLRVPKMLPDLQKISAEIYLDSNNNTNALAIYQEVLKKNPVAWAMHGKGVCLFKLGRLNEALTSFEKCISTNRLYLPSYDWKARTLEAMNEPHRAMETLKSASKLSPKSLSRQQMFARIATNLESHDLSVRALRHVVKNSQYTRHKDPVNRLKLAQSLLLQAEDSSGLQKKRPLEEAKQTINKLKKEVTSDPEMQARAHICLSQVLDADELHAQSKQELQKGLKIADLICPPDQTEALLEFAEAYQADGQTQRATELLDDFLSQHPDEDFLSRKARNLLTTEEQETSRDRAAAHNASGIQLYNANQIEKSITHFEKALSEAPDNLSYALNAIQSYLDLHQKIGVNKLDQARKIFTHFPAIDPNDYRYQRYLNLYHMIEDL
ncbi:MAG: response regulator [bacterium]